MKFSDKNYRLFVTAPKLVPTGNLLDTISHGGKVWAKLLKGSALYVPAALKLAEEVGEVIRRFQSMEARHETIVAEIADARDVLAFARKKLPGIPLSSDQKRNLPALRAELLALAKGPAGTSQQEAIREFIPIAENSLKSWCRIPGGITEEEIDIASEAKQRHFGNHQGWLLRAMALPRHGPEVVQNIIGKLTEPHWIEVDVTDFKSSTAHTAAYIKAVTPPG